MKPVLVKYIRLSLEDDCPGESNSVRNQRELLDGYIASQPSLAGYELQELCDDGYSGTSFNRPAMNQLLKLVSLGRVQCIMVKDYSRFGRNYIESGHYLEQVFPCCGVRFISVNDRFDSGTASIGDGGLDMAFKNLIHDLYSRDLSEKVRSARAVKATMGEFTSSSAFYGYKKSLDNKNKLEVDEPAAQVVQTIFQAAGKGDTLTKIARCLNERAMPTPSVYKRQKQGREEGSSDKNNFWTKDSVLRILRDERYTGKMICGKRRRILGKGVTVKVEREAWISVTGTHQPIVTEKTFSIAQEALRAYRSLEWKSGEERKTSGLEGRIYCGSCGHALRPQKTPYYVCVSGRYCGNVACTPTSISKAPLESALLALGDTLIKLYIDPFRLAEEADKQARKGRKERQESLRKLEKQEAAGKNAALLLYEGYKAGNYTKEQFISRKGQNTHRIEELHEQIERLCQELESQKKEEPRKAFLAVYSGSPWKNTLTKALGDSFLDRVVLYGATVMEVTLLPSERRFLVTRVSNACI